MAHESISVRRFFFHLRQITNNLINNVVIRVFFVYLYFCNFWNWTGEIHIFWQVLRGALGVVKYFYLNRSKRGSCRPLVQSRGELTRLAWVLVVARCWKKFRNPRSRSLARVKIQEGKLVLARSRKNRSSLAGLARSLVLLARPTSSLAWTPRWLPVIS